MSHAKEKLRCDDFVAYLGFRPLLQGNALFSTAVTHTSFTVMLSLNGSSIFLFSSASNTNLKFGGLLVPYKKGKLCYHSHKYHSNAIGAVKYHAASSRSAQN